MAGYQVRENHEAIRGLGRSDKVSAGTALVKHSNIVSRSRMTRCVQIDPRRRLVFEHVQPRVGPGKGGADPISSPVNREDIPIGDLLLGYRGCLENVSGKGSHRVGLSRLFRPRATTMQMHAGQADFPLRIQTQQGRGPFIIEIEMDGKTKIQRTQGQP